MGFIRNIDKQSIRVQLVRERTRQLKQGYPWIFRDWLATTPSAPAGSRVMVRDKEGELLAFGMYDPESPLTVRVCATEKERLGDELIAERLQHAAVLRRTVIGPKTTGFRLLNGEGDGLPGLVCDLYGDHAVLKLDGNGPAGFWDADGIAQWLVQDSGFGIKTVYLRMRDEADKCSGVLHGTLPDSAVRFTEHGLTFQADIVHGQKTGFFFDQRENRARIKTFAKDREVLNLFGYTGGFSIYAGAGGARRVTTVDIAKPAIEEAKRNWQLNSLPADRHVAAAVDAFKFLEEARTNKQRWDLIVVDPPSFASAERQVEKAQASYQSLFTAALQVLDQDGVIALSSCSSHISFEMFSEICQAALSKARRRGTLLGVYGQPEDHPHPFACPELRYLKFFLLRVH